MMRGRSFPQRLGQSPVDDEGFAVFAEHDVAGLEVAVEDAAAVGVVHGFADVDEALEELAVEPNWVGEVVYDIPGDEWRRVQRAKGYQSIIVNGVETFANGECTGETPGQLLRHGRG